MVDVELFAQSARIEEALKLHSCSECIQWCSDNRNSLKKLKVRTFIISHIIVSCNSTSFVIRGKNIEHIGIQFAFAGVHWTCPIRKEDGGDSICSKVSIVMVRKPLTPAWTSDGSISFSQGHPVRTIQGQRETLLEDWSTLRPVH